MQYAIYNKVWYKNIALSIIGEMEGFLLVLKQVKRNDLAFTKGIVKLEREIDVSGIQMSS
jgi:hypothetical protein